MTLKIISKPAPSSSQTLKALKDNLHHADFVVEVMR